MGKLSLAIPNIAGNSRMHTTQKLAHTTALCYYPNCERCLVNASPTAPPLRVIEGTQAGHHVVMY